MRFLNGSQFNNSSKDAKTVAPCTCPAENKTYVADFTDIAAAVSVLFCIILIVLSGLNQLSAIIGIIILNIILICKVIFNEKAAENVV